MTDLGYVPLRDVPGMLPVGRNGKRVSVCSIYRWSQRGIRGVVLKTVQVGNVRATTREFLREFFVGISLIRNAADSNTKRESARGRQRAAGRILDRAGIREDRTITRGGRSDSASSKKRTKGSD